MELNQKVVNKVKSSGVKNVDACLLYLLGLRFNLSNIENHIRNLGEDDLTKLQANNIIKIDYSHSTYQSKLRIDLFTENSKKEEVYSASDAFINKLRLLFKDTKKGAMGASFTVKNKLNRFFREHDYTPDQVYEIAKKYVESFHGNYTYMKQLDYFIYKKEGKRGEETSTLLAWLEEDIFEKEDAPKNTYGKDLL